MPAIQTELEEVKKVLLADTDSCMIFDGWANKSAKRKLLVFTLRNVRAQQLFLCSHDISLEKEDTINLKENIEKAAAFAKNTSKTDVVSIISDNDAKIKAGAREARVNNRSLFKATCSLRKYFAV